jgi:CheY-like chemotaxis protein
MSNDVWVIDTKTENLNTIERVFNGFSPHYTLKEFKDTGLKILAQLKSAPKDEWPRIIFLDLDMEGFLGFEILEAIKSDPLLKVIPIIIYSASDYSLDVNYSYQSLANAYIHFNGNAMEVSEKLEQTCLYWLKLVQPAY